MNPLIMTLLDILVIIAVSSAIYYMRIVAKSMVVIREGKSEMQQVLKEMTGAIAKADETIKGMQRLADEKARLLQKQIDTAVTMTEELKFISQAADKVAQRLEKGATVSANAKPVAGGPAKPPAAATRPTTTSAPAASPAPAGMSKAERDLAAALSKRRQQETG